ncbi:hypothetical protein SISNIDRAFT_491987 [Sistotremastrum niveocremeum HHB9708]|uniref:Uncharacterized protein n=1 Tax=Sistotremastrum niveocremeum HHB9708 TaxID=1314777 RepID=A0A164M648_9AGAM|nr:hypothetical protein SISNIDRAFT_491987 [Sistotremastrum niveocremeum HHB9708]
MSVAEVPDDDVYEDTRAYVASSREVLTWSTAGPQPWKWPMTKGFDPIRPDQLDHYSRRHLLPPPRCPCAFHDPDAPPGSCGYRIVKLLDADNPGETKIRATCSRNVCETEFFFDDYFENDQHTRAIYPKSAIKQPGLYSVQHRILLEEEEPDDPRPSRFAVSSRPHPHLLEVYERPIVAIDEFRSPPPGTFGYALRLWEPLSNVALAHRPMEEVPIPDNAAELLSDLVYGSGVNVGDLMQILDRCPRCPRILSRRRLTRHLLAHDLPYESDSPTPSLTASVIDLTDD